ncbi:MAG: hypothetical protein QHH75_12260 [Bacillota bacterium]|nr:hypothetical protein [Bacillota bacterium]
MLGFSKKRKSEDSEAMDLAKQVFGILHNLTEDGFSVHHDLVLANLRNVTAKFLLYRPILAIVDAVQDKMWDQAADVVFVGAPGTKFAELIARVHRDTRVRVFVHGKNDRRFCLQKRIPYLVANQAISLIASAYAAASQQDCNALVQAAIDSVYRDLLRVRPKAVILWNDGQPFERVVVLAARMGGIPSLAIQHGIFQRAWLANYWDSFADYFAVWGKYFKELYVAQGLDEGRVLVLGYPFFLPRKSSGKVFKNGESRKLQVCFLGQDFEKYSPALVFGKRNVVTTLVSACRKSGMRLVYRPHPREDVSFLRDILRDIDIISPKVPLWQLLEDAELFFSISSTALVEASLYEKIAVQVHTPEIPADNFEEIGLCYTVDSEEREVSAILEQFIQGKLQPRTVTESCIETSADPAKSLVGILASIGIRL